MWRGQDVQEVYQKAYGYISQTGLAGEMAHVIRGYAASLAVDGTMPSYSMSLGR